MLGGAGGGGAYRAAVVDFSHRRDGIEGPDFGGLGLVFFGRVWDADF